MFKEQIFVILAIFVIFSVYTFFGQFFPKMGSRFFACSKMRKVRSLTKTLTKTAKNTYEKRNRFSSRFLSIIKEIQKTIKISVLHLRVFVFFIKNRKCFRKCFCKCRKCFRKCFCKFHHKGLNFVILAIFVIFFSFFGQFFRKWDLDFSHVRK